MDIPEVVFFHKDYQKVVQEIKFEQGFWRVFISLLSLIFGFGFVLGGGKSLVPLFAGVAVFAVAVMARVLVDIDPQKKDPTFDLRDLYPWSWGGVIPHDHTRFSEIYRSILGVLKPLEVGGEIFSDYWNTRDKISAVLTDWAEEIIRFERAGVGQEKACVERRERFHTTLNGLAAQGEGCIIPSGIQNHRRYYSKAAEERLAKK